MVFVDLGFWLLFDLTYRSVASCRKRRGYGREMRVAVWEKYYLLRLAECSMEELDRNGDRH